jgi:chromosome segregation ATPase
MNRTLQFVNLGGVLLLAALCVFQWQRDRRLNLDLRQSEKTRQAHQQKIGEQDRSLRGLNADLTQLKEQLGRVHADAKDSQQKLETSEQENRQLTTEREQLLQSVTNWSNAVTVRDQRLTEANERIRTLAGDLNASVQKFNELVTNYNAVVQSLNDLRGAKSVGTNAQASR